MNRDTIHLLEEHDRARQALLEDVAWPGLESHLAVCPVCRKLAARLARLDQMTPRIPPPRPGLLAELMLLTLGIQEPRPGLLEDLRRATGSHQGPVGGARGVELDQRTQLGQRRILRAPRLLAKTCPECGALLALGEHGRVACSSFPRCRYIWRPQQRAATLPIINDSCVHVVPQQPTTRSRGTASTAMERPGDGVLLVEDDVAIAEFCASRLRQHGFDVNVTLDAQSAVAAFLLTNPAMVCLDRRVPASAIITKVLGRLGARVVLFGDDQTWSHQGGASPKAVWKQNAQLASMIAELIGSMPASAHPGRVVPAPGPTWTRR